MTTVHYIGTSDVRTVREADFIAAGVNDQEVVTFSSANGWEQDVSTAAGTWLLTLSDFDEEGIDRSAGSSSKDPYVEALYVQIAELMGDQGRELAYAERTTVDTTTNTDWNALAANKISGLVCEVVGKGRPVKIEFFCPMARHSVVGKYVAAILLTNGEEHSPVAGTFGATSTPEALYNRFIYFQRRALLVDGVTYTFEVAKILQEAGTGTFDVDAGWPMHLSVTGC